MIKLNSEAASEMANRCQNLWDEATALAERGDMAESDKLVEEAGSVESCLLAHGYNVHTLLAEIRSKCKVPKTGWIGIDLDGVLAEYNGWAGEDHIGKPIPNMVQLVRDYINQGYEVRVFTARACVPSQVEPVTRWLVEVAGLPPLRVTCSKDIGMLLLYDDRCVQMLPNTGIKLIDLVDKATLAKHDTHRHKNTDVYPQEYIEQLRLMKQDNASNR